MLQANGVAACTVVNGKRDKFVVDGVIADGNGGYSPSTIEVLSLIHISSTSIGDKSTVCTLYRSLTKCARFIILFLKLFSG